MLESTGKFREIDLEIQKLHDQFDKLLEKEFEEDLNEAESKLLEEQLDEITKQVKVLQEERNELYVKTFGK